MQLQKFCNQGPNLDCNYRQDRRYWSEALKFNPQLRSEFNSKAASAACYGVKPHASLPLSLRHITCDGKLILTFSTVQTVLTLKV